MSARILVVEDSDTQWAAMRAVLARKPGWEVDRAAGGGDALRMFGRATYDLAVIDQGLPDMAGVELLPKLRALNPSLLTLFFSADGSEGPALDALSLGAAEYVSKGRGGTFELVRRIETLLSERELRSTAGVMVSPAPRGARDERPHPSSVTATRRPDYDVPALRRALADVRAGNILGAGVFDAGGHAIATEFPIGIDPAIGEPLVRAQAAAEHLMRRAPPATAHRVSVHVSDEVLVCVATIPGPAVLALVVDRKASLDAAVAATQALARRIVA